MSEKQSGIRELGIGIVASIIGGAILLYVIVPAVPFLSMATFALYNFIVTLYALLLLIALTVGVWIALKGAWKRLAHADLRHQSWENFTKWPNSKWDLLTVAAVTYFVAVIMTVIAMKLVLPAERISSKLSPEEFASIFIIVVTPLLLMVVAILGRAMFGIYQAIKQQWASGTRKERIIIAVTVSFFAIVWLVIVIGDMTGWDDALWFNS